MTLSVTDLAGAATQPWHGDAACAGRDPELFFSSEKEQQEAALEVCRDCPVRRECLSFALANDEMYGIWGGMTEADRRGRIRRRRRRQREQHRTREAA